MGKAYDAALSSSMAQAQASQGARAIGQPSNADAWIGMIVAVVAVGAIAEIFQHSSWSSSERSHGGALPAGGSDFTPNWNYATPTPVAVDPPTRPSLYHPNNPTRSVNGDLTDPSIARR